MDMVQMQVAVAITDTLLTNAGLEKLIMMRVKVAGVQPDRLKGGPRNCDADKIVCLLKVLVRADFQLLDAAQAVTSSVGASAL